MLPSIFSENLFDDLTVTSSRCGAGVTRCMVNAQRT